MLENTDRDTVARAWVLAGALIGFLGLFVAPMLYGTVTFLCGLLAVWFDRPEAGVILSARGSAVVVLGAF